MAEQYAYTQHIHIHSQRMKKKKQTNKKCEQMEKYAMNYLFAQTNEIEVWERKKNECKLCYAHGKWLKFMLQCLFSDALASG